MRRSYNQNDPYTYPGTTVLINKANVRNQEALEEYELALYTAQMFEPLPKDNFDEEHLKAIHRQFFSELYDWAGEERIIDIAKGDSYFAAVPYINNALNKLLSTLPQDNYLKNLDHLAFCEKISYYFNELNAIHPFLAGNGRTQRSF